MLDPIRSSELYKRVARILLELDAYVDSSIFDSGRRTRESYENFSEFMHRFHVRGFARALVELVDETLTLSLAGGILAVALAVSAFRMTSDDWLKKQDLSITFLDRYGAFAGQRGIKHDDTVSLDQYPDHLIKAVLATEDRRFYEHFGIDVVGTTRALSVNARSAGVVQGGSSITQQLAKNLFLSNERTLTRKINEAFLSLWLEQRLTKQEILKLYLDRVYMGGGTFGIQAAAEFYFGKSVRDLTLAEAAMLAGVFKAPAKYAPHVNLPAARARANDVLDNLVDAGFMTGSQIVAAQRSPATPVDRQRDSSPDWYLDFAFAEVQKLADAGKLGDDRVLTVRTTLDPNIQKRADSVTEEQLRANGRAFHVKQSASVFMDLDGAVRAMVGGRDYGVSQFNRATEAMRQPGSSFKPYVYLTALMTGKFKPTTIVVDSPVCIGNWCPHNYKASFAGSLPLTYALARSLNTVAVKLSIAIGDGNPRVGRAKIVDTARRLGITAPLEDTVSLPIGADEVAVIEHAAAYAAFANGGLKTTSFAAVEIRNSRGDVIYRHDRDASPQTQAVPFGKIADLDFMMKKVVDEGTGRRAQLGESIDVIGKTGTTNGFKDAWFCGYSGNMGGCVWFGNDDDTPMNKMTGGTVPAQTWHDIMAYAHQGIQLKPIPGLVASSAVAAAAAAGAAAQKTLELGAPQRPAALSRGAIEALDQIETKIRRIGKERSGSLSPATTATDSSARGATMSQRSVDGTSEVE